LRPACVITRSRAAGMDPRSWAAGKTPRQYMFAGPGVEWACSGSLDNDVAVRGGRRLSMNTAHSGGLRGPDPRRAKREVRK